MSKKIGMDVWSLFFLLLTYPILLPFLPDIFGGRVLEWLYHGDKLTREFNVIAEHYGRKAARDHSILLENAFVLFLCFAVSTSIIRIVNWILRGAARPKNWNVDMNTEFWLVNSLFILVPIAIVYFLPAPIVEPDVTGRYAFRPGYSLGLYYGFFFLFAAIGVANLLTATLTKISKQDGDLNRN